MHGSTSRDETQSQAPVARKLLDWKANTPTFSASPSPLPLRLFNPSFRHTSEPRVAHLCLFVPTTVASQPAKRPYNRALLSFDDNCCIIFAFPQAPRKSASPLPIYEAKRQVCAHSSNISPSHVDLYLLLLITLRHVAHTIRFSESYINHG